MSIPKEVIVKANEVIVKANEELRERYIKKGIIRPVISVDANGNKEHCYKYPFNPNA